MSEVSDQEPDARAATAAAPRAQDAPKEFWEFADLGFDTKKNLWFIQFYNERNENVGLYFAKSVNLTGGRASQYYWKDTQGRPFWHVRERFFPADIESFAIDPAGVSITLNFREESGEEDVTVPPEFAYLLYAFHLSGRSGGRAPMGFVEFYDSSGALIRTFDNRWIIVEGVSRRTVGEFPRIRLRVERADIGEVTLTRTALVIRGRK